MTGSTTTTATTIKRQQPLVICFEADKTRASFGPFLSPKEDNVLPSFPTISGKRRLPITAPGDPRAAEDGALIHPASKRPKRPEGEPDGKMAPPRAAQHSPAAARTTGGAVPREEQNGCRPEDTLFVIDWDDTLLASSWLAKHGLALNSAAISWDVKAQLEQLEAQMVVLLEQVLSLGRVAIITNAESGWVEMSAQKFTPRVAPLLDSVRILSARSSYEEQHPNDPQRWKVEAYRLVFQEAFEPQLRDAARSGKLNVVSFGDAMYERNAALDLGKTAENALVKSVKFIERPTLEQVREQIDILSQNLDQIVKAEDPIDMMLSSEVLEEEEAGEQERL